MSRCVALEPCFLSKIPRWVRLAASLALLAATAACGGGHPAYHARTQFNPSRYYPPPGPHEDPWGPYIREASGRFGVPRDLDPAGYAPGNPAGQEDVISWAGAIGPGWQVMPETYEGLRDRYNLGNDPFDPHNNILAGTAYLREMYDRYGAPGFLAAYNAGPNRLDRYLSSGTPLPTETVNYVASIAPLLGPETPMSGPLAVYAGPMTRMAARPTPAGCDPDAAYNPNGPCVPFRQPVIQPVAVAAATPGYCDPDAAYNPNGPCVPARQAVIRPVAVAAVTPGYCDPDAAYNPDSPCTPLPPAAVQPVAAAAVAQTVAPSDCDPDAAYDPTRRCRPLSPAPEPIVAQALPRPTPRRPVEYAMASRPIQERAVQPAAFVPWEPSGRWAIQVGAFANLATAQAAAESARSVLPDLLRTAKVELPATTPFGSHVAFRARLFGLSPATAADACAHLSGRGMACITVPPPRDSF